MERELDLLALQGAACVVSSWNLICSTPLAGILDSSFFYSHYLMLQLDMNAALSTELDVNGLVLEFGVYHGKSIRVIASGFPSYQV